MSRVTNYILLAGCGEIDEVGNAMPVAIDDQHMFMPVDDHAGGYKGFEATCWLLAGNYLEPEAVCRALAAVPFVDTDRVQLGVRGEEEFLFTFITWTQIERLARGEIEWLGDRW